MGAGDEFCAGFLAGALRATAWKKPYASAIRSALR
ncbi:hypothetical protein P4H42_08715 [Paenibacillus macerans]|nr:hypothetical protein [Paenibacillus macerans]MEC0329697.1 hypothetical protein [Paenibacillus macerans]MED4955894.1 hypothetical protein [Paenibacillus macerans]